MKREVKKHLYDIKISIESIYEFLGDKRDFIEYYMKARISERGFFSIVPSF